MARTGRPRLDDPRNNRVSVRLSNAMLAQLEAYAEKHCLSKAQVLMNGMLYLLENDKDLPKVNE
jgi:hypothetical protein